MREREKPMYISWKCTKCKFKQCFFEGNLRLIPKYCPMFEGSAEWKKDWVETSKKPEDK